MGFPAFEMAFYIEKKMGLFFEKEKLSKKDYPFNVSFVCIIEHMIEL